MSILYEKVLSKAFYAMDPETAHQCGLRGMGLIGSIAPLRWLMERGLSPEGAKPVNVVNTKGYNNKPFVKIATSNLYIEPNQIDPIYLTNLSSFNLLGFTWYE